MKIDWEAVWEEYYNWFTDQEPLNVYRAEMLQKIVEENIIDETT